MWKLPLVVLCLLFSACGGRGAPLDASHEELGRKHCNINADCASGLCTNGLCG